MEVDESLQVQNRPRNNQSCNSYSNNNCNQNNRNENKKQEIIRRTKENQQVRLTNRQIKLSILF